MQNYRSDVTPPEAVNKAALRLKRRSFALVAWWRGGARCGGVGLSRQAMYRRMERLGIELERRIR